MMLLNRDSAIRSASKRLCTVYKSKNSVPCQPSGRRDIRSERPTVQTSSVQTTRTFRPDLPLCREASNCSSLLLSGRFSSTSGWHSVFNPLRDFFPKNRYGKFGSTVKMMCEKLKWLLKVKCVHKCQQKLKEKPLWGSQTQEFHYSEDKARYKIVIRTCTDAVVIPWSLTCNRTRTLPNQVHLPEGVFSGTPYLRADL